MSDLGALQQMALFVEVARTGSFSRASRSLSVAGATLSRRIAALEKGLGVRLFDRTTRRVALTDAGRRYLERCGHLVDEARLAQEAVRETASRPSGHLRVTMPVDLGVFVIGPLLPDFARQFPGITFDLDLSPRHVDLIGEQVDLAIRLGAVQDGKLVARRIGKIEQGLFTAPAYLERRGSPSQPADLVEHECIVVPGSRRAVWRLQQAAEITEVAVGGRFAANNLALMRLLAERGMGIAVLAPPLVREAVTAGRLVAVLPDWTVPPLPIHAVISSRMQPASVRALIEFLTNRLAVA
jgi:DNA-binding transcriptional LysR family regulator